jgi:hypothetical protein
MGSSVTIPLIATFPAGTTRVELRLDPTVQRNYITNLSTVLPSSSETTAQLSFDKISTASIPDGQATTLYLHLNGNNTPSDSVTMVVFYALP